MSADAKSLDVSWTAAGPSLSEGLEVRPRERGKRKATEPTSVKLEI